MAALKGLERDSPESQADPAPLEAIVLMAEWAVSPLGREGFDVARALFVAHDVSFRPGELLVVSVRNILVRRAAAISMMALVPATNGTQPICALSPSVGELYARGISCAWSAGLCKSAPQFR
jgi:hypothetical protein